MQQYKFFPLRLEDGVLSVVMSDPSDVETLDAIRLQSGCAIRVFLASEREILNALEQHYAASSSMERIVRDIQDDEAGAEATDDVAQLKDLASEAPVIRLVNLVISKAVESRASDIHIEPFEKMLRVRYRIDGVLVDTESPPKRLQAAVASRVKLMAKMNIAERRLPQDGRIRMEVGGKDLDLRVSTIPTIYGESVVMRLLDRSSVLLGLDELGFPRQAQERFEALTTRPHGMILVTGPTGSGKTTTLYAGLRRINAVEKKIITIEDPVEYQLEGVNQIQVKPRIGLTFASGLRHIVRQDPDVVLVGEIRDRETADIAIHAALTGHLLLSTLHTNDAAGAVTRLLDMGVENYLVSSTLLAVLAQRLVRRICSDCKSPFVPAEKVLQDLGIAASDAGRVRLFRGEGCAACNGTGYHGRLGIFEFLVMDDAVQRLILEKADANVLRAEAMRRGMTTLWQDGCEKVAAGITTYEEIVRVTRET
jgi:general secretion pathway protein E